MKPLTKILIVVAALLVIAAAIWLTTLHKTAPKVSAKNTAQAAAPDDSELERLRSLGYVDFAEKSDDKEGAGVVLRDKSLSYPGFNLYTTTFVCSATLMDEDGNIENFWKDDESCERWANVEFNPATGDLLVIGRDVKTGKKNDDITSSRYVKLLNWKGKQLWKRPLPAHHDMERSPSGDLTLLTMRIRKIVQDNEPVSFRDNYVTRLTKDGEFLEEYSLYDLYANSPEVVTTWQTKPTASKVADVFHANSVEWVRPNERTGTNPIYSTSNILISLRHQDTVLIMDWNTKKVLWAWGHGEIDGQHDATMLHNGNILIFDNGLSRGWSRVIEVDPTTNKLVWQYKAAKPADFYSSGRGSNQRLPNGNTLISESNKGRAFEVTPDGKIVWKFNSPFTDTEGRRAAIVRMYRFERSQINKLVADLGEGVHQIPAEVLVSRKSAKQDDGY